MKKNILFISLLLPFFVSAYTLKVPQGITVYTINGVYLSSNNNYELVKDKNQIAVKFDGKLSDRGKSKQLSTRPYLLSFSAQDDVELNLVSKRYKDIKSLIEEEKLIFEDKNNGITITQTLLPAITKIFPYSNVPKLVTHYNETNGIYFDETGLKQLSKVALKEQVQVQETVKESKVVAQLKYWYGQASKDEKQAFDKWLKKK